MTKNANQSKLISSLLLASSLMFVIAAVFAAGRETVLSGIVKIITSPEQLTLDSAHVGGISAAFLNVGIVGIFCWLLITVSKAKVNSGTIMGYFLTIGFAFYGLNFINIFPCFLGCWVYAKLKHESFSSYVNIAMFSTACAPFVSELMFRYPAAQATGTLTIVGVVLGVVVGAIIGFLMPAACAHSPNAHKGYSLYSAALPAGMIAFILVAILFKTRGIDFPTNTSIGDPFGGFANIFLGIYFAVCLITGFVLNGCSFKGYLSIFRNTGFKTDFITTFGFPVSLIHIGTYGLFIVAYYNLVGAAFTAVVVGAVFCMLSVCLSGAHALNVLPIMIGYAIASSFSSWNLDTTAIAVGLCFATGLSPIVGRFGIIPGIFVGILHGCCVTLVPALHGGFCLYNGGLTCCLIAILIAPVYESFMTPCEKYSFRLFAPFTKKDAKV